MITIYTDGACRKGMIGGWGVLYEDDEQTIELYGGATATTNNRMELTAVLEGLRLARQESSAGDIVIYTDSRYVCNGLTDWMTNWKKNNWQTANKTPVLNKDLWMDLDAVMMSRVRLAWVKGHNGCEGNEKADELANKGCDLIV
jgi:ribonuclease HI